MQFSDSRKSTLLERHSELLRTLAREGDKEAGKDLLWLLADYGGPGAPELDKIDEAWVKSLAEKFYVPAVWAYLNAKKYTLKSWKESFIDEDTGETCEIERRNVEDETPVFDLTEEERTSLLQRYFDSLCESPHELDVQEGLTWFLDGDLDQSIITGERAKRCIETIERITTYYSSREWLEKMADVFYYGCPEMGIFRNNKKAQEYYHWLHKRIEYLAKPYEYLSVAISALHIKGTAEQLGKIQTLVEKFCQKCGIPDNEDIGMYVPLDFVMKKLVGSDEYDGNIQSVQISDGVLTLELEHETSAEEALACALKDYFGPLEITIEEKEW